MKQLFSLIIIISLCISFVFAGGDKEDSSKTSHTIGLVTDTGGIDDKSFNQSTWEGILKFKEDAISQGQNISINYLQSESDADYIPNLSTLADEGYQLIISPGFLFVDSITEVSSNYPDTHFLIIDSVVPDKNNVASAVFAEHEGSFLVGIAAALQAQKEGKKKVGFIGGIDFDVIQRFEAGFEAGVEAIDPSIKVVVEYAGDFSNPQIGQTIATKMYDSGISVIFHAAGGTGNGIIKEAKDRAIQNKKVVAWVIGVDRNQYEEGIFNTASNQSVILTSMLKRVDVAAYSVSKQEISNNFPGNDVLYFDLSRDGVGIPKNNPNLSNETLTTIDKWKQKIVNGSYTISKLPKRLQ